MNDSQDGSELLTSDEDVADNDTSFHISQCSNNDTHTRESEFPSDCNNFETKPNNLSDETTIIVTWPLLKVLLCFYLQCNSSANIIKTALQGAMLVVTRTFQKGHTHERYSSQLIRNRTFEVNLFLAASILYTRNTYIQIKEMMDVFGLPIFSGTIIYKI